MSLRNIFLKFGKFLVLYLGCGCMTFNFTTQMILRHLLPMPMNKKLECKDHTSQFHQSWKIHLLINIFYMRMVKSFLKILWWRFLVPRSKCLLVRSATLSCKTQNILTVSMLVYYNTNIFFLRSFSPSLFSSSIKVSSVSKHNFFILKFHCFMLLLNFITSKYSFFRRII